MTPSPSSGTRAFDPDLKKAQIAEAAVRVFAERGVAKAKMIEVAREANVGKGTIYEYFRSKDELFEFAVRRFMDGLFADLLRDLSTTDDPEEQLNVLVRTTLKSIQKAGRETHIMFEIWAEGVRSGTEYFDLQGMYAEYRTMIAGILEAGIQTGTFREMDTLAAASIIIGALDGLLLQWIMDIDAFDLNGAGDELMIILANGLENK